MYDESYNGKAKVIDKQFSDRFFECEDCKRDQVWTAGEQAFLQRLIDRGATDKFGNPVSFITPKRCPACRAKRKAEREAREKAMATK